MHATLLKEMIADDVCSESKVTFFVMEMQLLRTEMQCFVLRICVTTVATAVVL